MRRLLYASLVLFCFAASATEQTKELLLTPQGAVGVIADPLADVLRSQPEVLSRLKKYLPKEPCSVLWRGYLGTWEIRSDELHLVKLIANDCKTNDKSVPLDELFPGSRGSVVARWYSGEILLEIGPFVRGPCSFSFTCPSTYEVTLVNHGKVVGRERRKPHMEEAPNPSIERTSPGKPGAASHVKRWASLKGGA